MEEARSLPALHVSGNYYSVGYAIGKTFRQQIQEYFRSNTDIKDAIIPFCNTGEGKKIYEEFLVTTQDSFPQYVTELQGIADGSSCPFEKLFMNTISQELIAMGVLDSDRFRKTCDAVERGLTGCTDIFLNPEEFALGHTEDYFLCLEHSHGIITAHILSEEPMGKHGVLEEDWTAISYFGFTPGYSMGFNKHGVIYTINDVIPNGCRRGKLPVQIMVRALLAARSTAEVEDVLRDEGCGIASGVSVNLMQPLEKMISNYEVAYPQYNETASRLDVCVMKEKDHCLTVPTRYHVNIYHRINAGCDVPSLVASSKHREAVIQKMPPIKTIAEIMELLSDSSDGEYPIFRSERIHPMKSITLFTAIFDLNKYTCSLYLDRCCASSGPLVVFNLPRS